MAAPYAATGCGGIAWLKLCGVGQWLQGNLQSVFGVFDTQLACKHTTRATMAPPVAPTTAQGFRPGVLQARRLHQRPSRSGMGPAFRTEVSSCLHDASCSQSTTTPPCMPTGQHIAASQWTLDDAYRFKRQLQLPRVQHHSIARLRTWAIRPVSVCR